MRNMTDKERSVLETEVKIYRRMVEEAAQQKARLQRLSAALFGEGANINLDNFTVEEEASDA